MKRIFRIRVVVARDAARTKKANRSVCKNEPENPMAFNVGRIENI